MRKSFVGSENLIATVINLKKCYKKYIENLMHQQNTY